MDYRRIADGNVDHMANRLQNAKGKNESNNQDELGLV